jgi:hypothetical protein
MSKSVKIYSHAARASESATRSSEPSRGSKPGSGTILQPETKSGSGPNGLFHQTL